MATWPAGLPAPMLTSYHNADTFPHITTRMQSGPSRRTRYSNHYMTTGQMTLTVDQTQAIALQGLIDSSNLGTDWITGVPLDTGTGLKDHRVRLSSVQRKVIKSPDIYWQFTLSFETDEHL